MTKSKTLERFIFLRVQISKSRGYKGLPWAMDQNQEMGCIHLLVYTWSHCYVHGVSSHFRRHLCRSGVHLEFG